MLQDLMRRVVCFVLMAKEQKKNIHDGIHVVEEFTCVFKRSTQVTTKSRGGLHYKSGTWNGTSISSSVLYGSYRVDGVEKAY